MQKTDFTKYRALAREVLQLREQLITLEASLFAPKVQQYKHTPPAQGKVCDMSDAVVRHLELEALYRDRLAAKLEQQMAIERALDSLDDPVERMIMRYRYIEGYSWGTIIAELGYLGYSERQVYRLHGFALLKLKEV